MQIGILGTGMVGIELGRKLCSLGHHVMMGSRTADNSKALQWAAANQPAATTGTFAQAAAFGEVIFNCTSGTGSLDALRLASAEHLADKILIDVSNPLDFSKGMPPMLSVCNTDSLGEQIQREFPAARVVKALNTVTSPLMTNPALVPGDHALFICGNDAEAKAEVTQWLEEWFGWPARNVIDLGDITNARGAEMLLPLWIRLMVRYGTPMFNFQINHAPVQPSGAKSAEGAN
jgi:8-hydroxy-5-deazaflavin:NADPH oxidoreductase